METKAKELQKKMMSSLAGGTYQYNGNHINNVSKFKIVDGKLLYMYDEEHFNINSVKLDNKICQK